MIEIDDQELLTLARAVADTALEEIDCDTFLDRAALYLERQRGRDLTPEMVAAEQHLRVCPECYEEFQVLKNSVEP